MYRAIQNLLKQNKETWEPLEAMTSTVGAFETLLSKIEAYRQTTGDNKTGLTAQKSGVAGTSDYADVRSCIGAICNG